MTKTHKRQKRPLLPPAWTVNGLCDALGIKRELVYAALRSGDLVSHKIGVRRFILTGSADEPGSVINWIKSHRS